MRLTVKTKIAGGLALIVIFAITSMLIVYDGLRTLDQAIHQLAEVEQPASGAAYEMEINLHGIGMGVLKYLDSRNPQDRKRVEKDQAAFEKFHAEYMRLAQTPPPKELGRRMAVLYQEFKALGNTLMDRRDQQGQMFAAVGKNFEKIDEIIDQNIQAKMARPRAGVFFGQVPDWLQKMETTMDIEADVAEVGLWLSNYQRTRSKEYRELIVRQEQEVLAALGRLKGNESLTPEERHWVGVLERTMNQTMVWVHQLLALDEALLKQSQKFVDRRRAMEHLLDEEIQILTMQDLSTPREEASQAIHSVVGAAQFLMPLFLLSALGLGLLLIRNITEPIRQLMDGTDAVSRGDRSHLIVPTGRDEFADLAQRFNQMVSQLETTTVSKGLLEASEEELRQTVIDLRREIAERQRAEEALRRSKMMAAMGSLVAGVAHEVRNPLFGISSAVDLLEARFAKFGVRQEYHRHIGILRADLHRLNKLMQDLLDYGKPAILEMASESLDEVFSQAMRHCGPLAERLQVQMVNKVPPGVWTVRMDRSRLIQVFQNLLQNALQHSPTGSLVTIEAEEVFEDEKRWIHCTVRDSGPGFKPEDLPRVLEPFFTRQRGGTGLGLSIVQRIVEGHDGKISAANRPEGGAAVTVTLPLPALAHQAYGS